MEKIISCPHCNINIALSVSKDIIFQCPNCGKHWEINTKLEIKEIEIETEEPEDNPEGSIFDEYER